MSNFWGADHDWDVSSTLEVGRRKGRHSRGTPHPSLQKKRSTRPTTKKEVNSANGRWLLDDFDEKKAECLAYVRDVREKYASGKYVKYLKSEKDLRQYIPDFKERVEAFYTKYGK